MPPDPTNPDPKNPAPSPDPNPDPKPEPIHNAKYLAELRDENKRIREASDAKEAELAELRKFKETTDSEKLKSEKKFEELADKERKAREKAEKDAADKVAAHERRAIKAEVKALAVAAGLEDADDVDLIDLSAVKFDDDKVVGASEAVEAFKKAKPHKFTDEKRGAGLPAGGNPTPGGKPGDLDARNLSAKDFDDLDQRLRAQR